MSKLFYSIADSDPAMTLDLLGGKGFHLARMVKAGVNVPPAYVITTEACRMYQQDPAGTMERIKKEVLPEIMLAFPKSLVSVRSGAKFSMPGMMDTLLNVGLDDSNFEYWEKTLGHDCAYDSYRRLVEMYSDVVKGIGRGEFKDLSIVGMFDLYEKRSGEKFPSAKEQVIGAVEAVFKSWDNDRAKTYRKLNGIPHDLGTAVVIQAMVFGNLNEKSCTGVLFTRDPNSGECKITGEFLVNAQGEDVVAGIRTPETLNKLQEWNPKVADELIETVQKLEEHARDMQDVEFTVQDGELFILQTRNAKRTALAAIQVAVAMVDESLITEKEAMQRVTFKQYVSVLRPIIAPGFDGKPIGEGLPASVGLATGKAVFSSADAVNSSEPCVLLSEETTPDDIAGMNAAKGVLTSRGGATSHAAVVARGMDKPCVVGCDSMAYKVTHATFTMGGEVFTVNAGDLITIDGSTGRVWLGAVPTVDASNHPALVRFAKMVERSLPYHRVCMSPEEVNGEGAVLFGTYLLDLLAYPVAAMTDAAIALSGREVIFDLRSYEDVLAGKSQNPLLDMFGKETQATDHKVVGLVNAKEIDKSKMSVLENGLTEEQVAMLKNAGYKIIPVVDSEKNLIEASGLVQVDLHPLIAEMGTEGLRALVEHKRTNGTAVHSFNIVGKVKASDLESGAKFALSRVNLMRSVLS